MKIKVLCISVCPRPHFTTKRAISTNVWESWINFSKFNIHKLIQHLLKFATSTEHKSGMHSTNVYQLTKVVITPLLSKERDDTVVFFCTKIKPKLNWIKKKHKKAGIFDFFFQFWCFLKFTQFWLNLKPSPFIHSNHINDPS